MAAVRRPRARRPSSRAQFMPLLAIIALIAVLISLLARRTKHASRTCAGGTTPAKTVIAALIASPSAASRLLDIVDAFKRPAPFACVISLYVATEALFRKLAPLSAVCVAQTPGCRVVVTLAPGAVHWAQLALTEFESSARVILVRHPENFSQTVVDRVHAFHERLQTHYDAGARRNIAALAQTCATPSERHVMTTAMSNRIDNVCVVSPVRVSTHDESPWAFFVQWFAARKREHLLWPHIWEEKPAVPEFWKGRSRTKMDPNLIWFGSHVGRNHAFSEHPHLAFEHWLSRWIANYSMKVVVAPAEASLAKRHSDGDMMPVVRDRSGEDFISLGEVWAKEDGGEFGQIYLDALKKILETRSSLVSLTMVSQKFLELTRSWLCNVQRADFVPQNIHWITLDEVSKNTLEHIGVGKTIDITGMLSADNMDAVNILYGQPAYWRLMLLRTRLIRDLLDRGIDVFLFETDQVWLGDPFSYLSQELRAGADVIGTLDTQHNVAGNTLFLRAVLPTRRMWGEVYRRFKSSYDANNVESMGKHEETFVQHDQYQVSDLLIFNQEFTREFPVALSLLNAQLFVGGSWYSGFYTTQESKEPIIINNNFISGTDKKKTRAKTFGHWFLKEDGATCDWATVDKALRYEFARMPGKW